MFHCDVALTISRITSRSIEGIDVFFQAVHPVEYSRSIPEAMAEKLFNRAGREACCAYSSPLTSAFREATGYYGNANISLPW